MTSLAEKRPCPGCGALVPDTDGPAHPYIGASAGCWAVFCEVLAKEYGEYQYPAIHRLTVDAYAAQHPGTPSRRSIQSVATHLAGLCLTLEYDLGPEQVTAAMGRILSQRPPFVWLEPPPTLGAQTILDVASARTLAEHEQKVRQWACAVWSAWAANHQTVRHWAMLASPAPVQKGRGGHGD